MRAGIRDRTGTEACGVPLAGDPGCWGGDPGSQTVLRRSQQHLRNTLRSHFPHGARKQRSDPHAERGRCTADHPLAQCTSKIHLKRRWTQWATDRGKDRPPALPGCPLPSQPHDPAPSFLSSQRLKSWQRRTSVSDVLVSSWFAVDRTVHSARAIRAQGG